MSHISSSAPRLRFFTAEDALEIDEATSSSLTAPIFSSSPASGRRTGFRRRRRPSIVNSLESFDRPRSIIKLEGLGERGGRLIFLLQFIIFSVSIWLIVTSTYNAERRVFIEANRWNDKCNEYYASSADSIVSSCTATTLLQANDDNTSPSITTFTSTMSNLGSVFGRIDLNLAFPNSTEYGIDNSTTFASDGETIELTFDLLLQGCGKKPASKCIGDDWLRVLAMSKETSLVNMAEDSFGSSVDHANFFAIFQNQENIINEAWVKSYKLDITLYNNTKLLSPETNEMYFDFGYNDVEILPFEKELRMVFFFVNFFVLCYWLFKNFVPSATRTDFKMWVEEKKWITFLLIGTVLFQNPVLIVAQFVDSPSLGLVAMTKCSQLVAYATLCWVFLLFSDGMAFHSKSSFQFYFPKTVLIVIYLAASMVFELLSLPVFVSTKSRSPLLSTYNWSNELRVADLYLGLLILILNFLLGINFAINTRNTIRTLNKLPYVEYRYQHLSYRFYFFHSLSIFFYSLASYGQTLWRVIIDISGSADIFSVNFQEEFNILLRTTTSNVGQQLFVAFYVYVFVYLFLPPSKQSFMQTLLLKSFVKCEDPTPEKDVFCLETACWLLECTWQSYYDPPGAPTVGGWGDMDLEQHNLTNVATIHDEKETHVVLMRDTRRNRLVIAFRGTSCQKHWSTNLKYSMKKFNFDKLGTPPEVQQLLNDAMLDVAAKTSPPDLNKESSIFRSKIDTETHLGFDNLKHTLLKTTASPPLGRLGNLKLRNLNENMEGLQNFLGSVEKTVLQNLGGSVHGGFLDAYLSIRTELQISLTRALLESPSDVYVTGHSLGGALASICVYDLSLSLLPSLTKSLNSIWTSEIKEMGSDWIDHYSGRLKRPPTLSLYTYGAPRCFSRKHAWRMGELVKSSWRVACDGDIVPSFPKYAGGRGAAYKHAGTEVVVDGSGKGHLIMSPSFVERSFQMSNRTQLSKHSLQCYRKGLWGAIGQTAEDREQALEGNGLSKVTITKFLEMKSVGENSGYDEDIDDVEARGGEEESSFTRMEEFVDANTGSGSLSDLV